MVGIPATTVTYDFHRLTDGATKLKCSSRGFGDANIEHITPGNAGAGKREPAMARV